MRTCDWRQGWNCGLAEGADVNAETCDESCPVPREPCDHLDLGPGSLSIRYVYGQLAAMVTLRAAGCKRGHKSHITSEDIAACTRQFFADRCANLKPDEPLQ